MKRSYSNQRRDVITWGELAVMMGFVIAVTAPLWITAIVHYAA